MDAPVDPNKAIRIARFWAYPKQVLYLLASFIVLVSLCHFVSRAFDHLTRRRPHPPPRDPTATHPIRWRRLPPALLDSLRAVAFRHTISIGSSYTLNLAEVGLTLGYIGVLFSWTFVNTTNLQGMLVDPKYYANRAALIAASQVPIMTALGMRNNPISFLTGVSFDKLNYLHRLSARVICILAWIHGGGRITVGLDADEAIGNRWVQCGVLTVSTLTLMCILTVRPVRARAYEMFLLVHFIFAFIFLMGMFFHLRGRNIVYYGAWPSMLIWGVDRGIRLLQLALYNPASAWLRRKRTEEPQRTDARITMLTPHFLRITLTRPAGLTSLRWRPGQSAFLSFPTLGGAPVASHPFTIASLDTVKEEERTLVFLVRVRGGTTLRLARSIAPDAAGKAMDTRLPVLLNGPCSAPPMLQFFDTAVLFAGGSGVAFTLPLMLDVVRRASLGERTPRRVLFVWAVRSLAQLTWISALLTPALEKAPSDLSLSILVHITGSTASSSSSFSGVRESSASEDPEGDTDGDADLEKGSSSGHVDELELGAVVAAKERESMKNADADMKIDVDVNNDTHDGRQRDLACARVLLADQRVGVVRGRPAVSALLSSELGVAAGRVSVNVCGTHALAASVREALRAPRFEDVLRGGPTVSLHVEAFGDA